MPTLINEHMKGCEKCPRCHSGPATYIGDEGIILTCEKHGHMAVGDTIEMAVENWNHYIHLITKDPL